MAYAMLWYCAVLCFAAQQIQGKLVIEPEQAHFPFRGNMTVMCRAQSPITQCQFKINHWKLNFPVIDLSLGHQSQLSEGLDEDQRIRYKAQYHGKGLKDGECGLQISEAFWGRYVVSCRTKGEQGGWEQAVMTYRAGNPATFEMSLQPISTVALPGSDVNVLCDAGKKLDECFVVVPTADDYVDLSLGAQAEATSKYRYYGTGLDKGQCGVTLLNVAEEDNGPVWCWGEVGGTRGTARASMITVAQAPSDPLLELTSGTTYAAGQTLQAICTVEGSRPVASITWLLGSKVVRQDAVDDVPAVEWSWPWDKQTITQRLSIKLAAEDNGKEVICRTTHTTLKEPKETKIKIVVNGAGTAGQRPTSRPGSKPAGVAPDLAIRGPGSSLNLNLAIEPEHAHFPFRGNLTVMCRSKSPIHDCQFKINHWKTNFPVMDLSQGRQSATSEGLDEDGRIRYKAQYYGSSLKDGQCGIQITEAFWGRYVVGCRVRAERGGWEEATMTYRAGNPATFEMTLTPVRTLALPGSDVSVLCDAGKKIDECFVTLPTGDEYIDLSLGAGSNATGNYRYHGSGLQQGQCGVTVVNAQEGDSGPVWCWGEEGGSRGTARASMVTIANPPNVPQLVFTSGTSYAEGDTLTAICTVGGSRPVAAVTWMLNNKIVRQDGVDDAPTQEWSWPWERQTITQKLTLKLKKQDIGKDLTCSARNVAMNVEKSSKKTISVKGGPSIVRPLTIEPDHVQTTYRGNVTVMCQSDVPVSKCQFRLYQLAAGHPMIDLSEGHDSQQVTSPPSGGGRLQYKAEYHGTGLKDGQCGIALTKVNWGRYVVSCRTFAQESGWQQASMTFSAAGKKTYTMRVNPDAAVVFPGKDHSVVCESEAPLVSCYVDIPTQRMKEIFLTENDRPEAGSHYRYSGKGLSQGHCGVTLAQVTELDNGPVWCAGDQSGQRSSSRASLLTVAEPPTEPELVITSGTSYSAGSTLTATCSVGGSRPAATITWLLGTKVIREDAVDNAEVKEWSWPWDKQIVTQKVAVKLTAEDNGKDLVCKVSHLALKKDKLSSVKLNFNGVTGNNVRDTQRPSTLVGRPSGGHNSGNHAPGNKDKITYDMNLSITPDQAHIPFRGNMTVMCRTKFPIAQCQFKLNHWKLNFPVIDLSQGHQSAASEGLDEDERIRYKAQYHGTSLKDGQCGIQITEAFWGRYVVGCRVRPERGGWEQATMTYRAGNPATFDMGLQPISKVILPGSDVSVLCNGGKKLDQCFVVVPTGDEYVDLSLGAQSEATSKYRYHGSGLQNSQCGVTLLNAAVEDSGPVWCWGEDGSNRGTARASIITVAEPPAEPNLVLTSGTSYVVGATLRATCTVDGSRPSVNITWLLGGVVVRQDSIDDVPIQEWRWPWDRQSITQNLTVKLTKTDNGKELVCKATNSFMSVTKQSKVKLRVNAK